MYIDLLTKIKNAEAARKESLKVRFTNFDYAVLEALTKLGFVKKSEVKGRLPKRIVEVDLNLERPIQGLKFLSRPSRRLYASYTDLKKVKGGYGALIISTSKGVMNASEARRRKVGGQLLFEIW